jgi:hypothetical protein
MVPVAHIRQLLHDGPLDRRVTAVKAIRVVLPKAGG